MSEPETEEMRQFRNYFQVLVEQGATLTPDVQEKAVQFGLTSDTFIEVEMAHNGKRYKGILVQVKGDAS